MTKSQTQMDFFKVSDLVFGTLVIYHIASCFKVISRLIVVSPKAKKKEAVRDKQVSYLCVAPV